MRLILFVLIPAITSFGAVFIRESHYFQNGTQISVVDLKLYLALFEIIFLFFLAYSLYTAQKGIIKEGNKFNRYKLSKNNILIRLKLFKYDNDANYLLILPFIITLNIVFVVIALYLIYACGIVILRALLESIWLISVILFIIFIIILYYAIIRSLILDSCVKEKTGFLNTEKIYDEKLDKRDK